MEMRGKLLLYGTYISRLKKLENGIDSKKDEGRGELEIFFIQFKASQLEQGNIIASDIFQHGGWILKYLDKFGILF